jgi:hypothetical protein
MGSFSKFVRRKPPEDSEEFGAAFEIEYSSFWALNKQERNGLEIVQVAIECE